MYDNLQEKYKNSVYQIVFLKICAGPSNFHFNSTIRKKIHWVVQLFGDKVIERFSLTSRIEHPNQFSHILMQHQTVNKTKTSSLFFNMASFSDRNYDNPTLFHKIHHFPERNYHIVMIKFFSSSFRVNIISLFQEQRQRSISIFGFKVLFGAPFGKVNKRK